MKRRLSSIQISALNLVLHPHPKGAYESLIRTMHEEKITIRVRGDDAVLIGSCRYLDKNDPELGLTGYIYKFLKLDSQADWINTEIMQIASKDEIAEINIPGHLKPHFKRFLYIFKPNKHRFYFLSHKAEHNLSAGLMKRFFETASQHPALAKHGNLTVTVESARDSLNRIFSIDRIMTLNLEFTPPNPDDMEDLEADVMDRLNRINARSQKIIYQEADNSGLRPDDKVKALAKIAKENGRVRAEGKNAFGEKVVISTKDIPLQETTRYNPNVISEADAFYEKVTEIHQEIIR